MRHKRKCWQWMPMVVCEFPGHDLVHRFVMGPSEMNASYVVEIMLIYA